MESRLLEYIYSLYLSCALEFWQEQYAVSRLAWGKGFILGIHQI